MNHSTDPVSYNVKNPLQIQQLASNLLSPLMGNGVSPGRSDETLFSSSVQNLSLLFIFSPFPRMYFPLQKHFSDLYNYLFHLFLPHLCRNKRLCWEQGGR